jgi:hypothetical protein
LDAELRVISQDLEHSVFNAAEMIEEQGGFNVNMVGWQ